MLIYPTNTGEVAQHFAIECAGRALKIAGIDTPRRLDSIRAAREMIPSPEASACSAHWAGEAATWAEETAAWAADGQCYGSVAARTAAAKAAFWAARAASDTGAWSDACSTKSHAAVAIQASREYARGGSDPGLEARVAAREKETEWQATLLARYYGV